MTVSLCACACACACACSDCRQLLKEVNATNEYHILLDCATDRVLEVLRQAREMRMMSDYHSYFVTSLVSATWRKC